MTGKNGKKRMNGWLKLIISLGVMGIIVPLLAWALSNVRAADVKRSEDTAAVVDLHETRLDTLEKKVDSNAVGVSYRLNRLEQKVDTQYERQGQALKLLLEAGGVPRWRWPELDLPPDSAADMAGGSHGE